MTTSVPACGNQICRTLCLFTPRDASLHQTHYADHLLEQCRRLILGRPGLTVLLLDDQSLRRRLTSELAGEFGSRVVEESTAPEVNGVISACWDWWLQHQEHLPLPDQVIIGLLPIASLECPLTAARVEQLKQQGRDWFRTLLLPEPQPSAAAAPVRRTTDGPQILMVESGSRGWGEQGSASCRGRCQRSTDSSECLHHF